MKALTQKDLQHVNAGVLLSLIAVAIGAGAFVGGALGIAKVSGKKIDD